MPCIHGLDEINCPTCRIVNFSLPIVQGKIKDLRDNPLKPKNTAIAKNSSAKEKFLKDLIINKLPDNPKFISTISNPILLNTLPDFQNKMFLERLKEIDIIKSDTLGITKKISLERPEWKFEKEE